MKVLLCGSSGCVGSAVARALRARGHDVVEAARGLAESSRSMPIDFMRACDPAEWARRISDRGIDSVVNCVGILMPTRGQSFERVHTAGPIELFQGAALAGVRRVIQISALGIDRDARSLATPYLLGKQRADEALMALPMDWAVLRPSLVYGPGSQSGRLFATLASLPVIGLPGRGDQPLQPIQVYELAEVVVRLLEQEEPIRAVHELGGGERLSYRQMLTRYRRALGLDQAIWLPVPMPLMKLGAWLAEGLPQQVFCRDTVSMLECGNVPRRNAAPRLLGRAATGMAAGLAVTPPQPPFELRVELGPMVETAMRAALAFMWVYTAAVSAVLQEDSGVMELLARCGFEGEAGTMALLASCALNTALGALTWWRPSPWLYAAQCGAILGYTVTAAVSMPELTIDHCGPLVKNLPVLMGVVTLWLAHCTKRREVTARTADPAASGALPRA